MAINFNGKGNPWNIAYNTQHEKDIKKNRNDFLNKLKEV